MKTLMENNIVLALDCSLRLTGVAVSREGEVLACESLDLGRSQAAALPLIVERLLATAGVAFADIGWVAVTHGPGYFTGIRVGAAYAAALAYGLGVRVVPVPSLAMLATSCPAPSGREVLAVVYAGRGFVYAASFGSEEDALTVGEYGGESLRDWMGRHRAVAVSDDPGRAAEAAGLDFPILPVHPDVAKVAQLAWGGREGAVSPLEFRAVYCRAPQGTA